MEYPQIPKKEKGTETAPNYFNDSVKNQVKDRKYFIVKPKKTFCSEKPIVLTRNEIQSLLSNSINSLEHSIISDNNRFGSILKNERKNIENSLIKFTKQL